MDICDAIEEEDLGLLNQTDIQDLQVPVMKKLQRKLITTQVERERARDWVLSKSLDKKVLQPIMKLSCINCKKPMLETHLQCISCTKQYNPCIVTGMAILQPVQCHACRQYANMDDWNRYIKYQQQCPYCLSTETFKK